MLLKHVTVKNFRNYQDATLKLSNSRNLLIGENAQGKTNLLEAIEIMANMRRTRGSSDKELVMVGQSQAFIEVGYVSQGIAESASLTYGLNPRLSKTIKINGVKQTRNELSGRISRLTAVSFSSRDLSLLRGGPKDRRDWLDDVMGKLRHSLYELLSKYEKVVQQRNRLLKNLFEKGRVTVSDQEELKVWDAQLCRYGSRIIKSRVDTLALLLPQAEENQSRVSGLKERLNAAYIFREHENDEEENADTASVSDLVQATVEEIEERIARSLKTRRAEEIARKQTLTGPHRDDISFALNDLSAQSFGSQGQQRSLVLSLKLAELKLVEEHLAEPPLLLLDDVLAELDLSRQGMLMELVQDKMQTLITTTHLDGFRPEWLTGAQITKVAQGRLES